MTNLTNQGTSTDVLHGNAAGQPTYSQVVEADILLSNNLTNDVTITRHGLVPKAPNDVTKFLRGDGTWAVVPGASEAFPVGSVFAAIVSTNPGTLLGYGTWVAFGAGRTLVGRDSGDPDFDTAEETGGEKTHVLTSTEMPTHTHVQNSHNHTQDAHNHTQNAHSHTQRRNNTATGANSGWTTAFDTSSSDPLPDTNTGTGGTTAVNQAATAVNQPATAVNQNAGSDGAHNNVQPYIVVYFWKRTA